MLTIRILTLNAAVQDVRILGHSVHCPVLHPQRRLQQLPRALFGIDADIICLQEMFHRDLQYRLYHDLHKTYPFAAGFASAGPKLRLGNELLVFSRFPISRGSLYRFTSAAGEELRYTSRGFFHISVQIPGIGNVELINFHATAGGVHDHPESPAMESIRDAQIRQIQDHVAMSDRALLVGDLNAGPHSSIDNYRRMLDGGMVDAFAAAGGTGITWDPSNPLVAMGSDAALPAQRIDHVFLSGGMAAMVQRLKAEIVFNERTVSSSDGFIPLSDHYGITVELRFHEKRAMPTREALNKSILDWSEHGRKVLPAFSAFPPSLAVRKRKV